MGVTNPILSHRKCPCCFDCGECIKSFVIDTDCTIPALDGSWTTCKNHPLASWATLSETPKGLNGEQWVYATLQNSEPPSPTGVYGLCDWQAAQYCVDNPAGHRGRAWVVDLWLHDNVANTTVRYSSGQVTDWVCTCDGPRFSWALQDVTDLGCFQNDADACEDCTGKCLRVTLPALASNPFSPDCGPQPTATQIVDVVFGRTTTVSAAGTAPDVTTWTIETKCSLLGGVDVTITYDCPTQNPTAIAATYRRTGDCFGEYTQISGDTTYLPATLTVVDCCNPTTDYCLGCTETCLTATIPAFTITVDGCTVAERTLTFNLDSGHSPCWYIATPDAIYEYAYIYWNGVKWQLVLRIKATGSGNCQYGTGTVVYSRDSCTGDYVYDNQEYPSELSFPAGPITVTAC